jgi:hypothetical protein
MNAEYIARELREAGFSDVGLDERRGPTYVHFTPTDPKRGWEAENTGSSIVVTERGIGSATVRMPAVDPEKRYDAEDAARAAASTDTHYPWTYNVKQAPLGDMVSAHINLHHNANVSSVDRLIEDILSVRAAYQGAMYN